MLFGEALLCCLRLFVSLFQAAVSLQEWGQHHYDIIVLSLISTTTPMSHSLGVVFTRRNVPWLHMSPHHP